MTRSYTADELVTKCRNRGGYENSGRLTAAKWYDFLESGVSDLWDLLVSKYSEDYFTKRSGELSFVIDQETYDLPSDLLKLLGVDLKVGDDWHRVQRFSLHERNYFQRGSLTAWYAWGAGADQAPYRYRIEGNKLVIAPIPSAAETYRLVYVEAPPKISTGAEVIDGFGGWEELIVLYAVRSAKRSQNEPVEDILREIAQKEARISWAADGRDAAEPISIADLDSGEDYP